MPTPNAPATPDAPYSELGSLFASPWYLRVDDNLRITSYNALAAVVLEIRYRMVDCAGAIQATGEKQTPNTDRTAKASIVPTPEGWLLGGEVFVSAAAPLLGQTYVVVEIVRGLGASALPLETIARGYVTAKQPLRFPALSLQDSLDGAGALRSIIGATPGAGAEVSETVPTGARWDLLAFRVRLVTAVAAANRFVELLLDDGGAIPYARLYPVAAAQIASTTFDYTFGHGLPNTAGQSSYMGPLPNDLRLGAGHRIRTTTTGIQGADQFSQVQYLVREWIEGA